jgi:hypothetical protein
VDENVDESPHYRPHLYPGVGNINERALAS